LLHFFCENLKISIQKTFLSFKYLFGICLGMLTLFIKICLGTMVLFSDLNLLDRNIKQRAKLLNHKHKSYPNQLLY
jgi:hypothetical protein